MSTETKAYDEAVNLKKDLVIEDAPGAVILVMPEGQGVRNIALTPKAALTLGVRLIFGSRRAASDLDSLYAESSEARP